VSFVALLLSTLGSLYPALCVLSVQPAETLRYE
jgi:ABC-type lipoprotein release transport system permease subunit